MILWRPYNDFERNHGKWDEESVIHLVGENQKSNEDAAYHMTRLSCTVKYRCNYTQALVAAELPLALMSLLL